MSASRAAAKPAASTETRPQTPADIINARGFWDDMPKAQQATAAQIELFCRLSVLVQSVPILLALLETIQEFMA